MENTAYKNVYPLWVYPQDAPVAPKKAVNVLTKLDANTLKQLQGGAPITLYLEIFLRIATPTGNGIPSSKQATRSFWTTQVRLTGHLFR